MVLKYFPAVRLIQFILVWSIHSIVLQGKLSRWYTILAGQYTQPENMCNCLNTSDVIRSNTGAFLVLSLLISFLSSQMEFAGVVA